ncbi:HIT domain-containing protein [Pseudomonas syringae]|uniref:HIT family protein n=1 Tax=Pseudomonas syringae TaxID=317 RepID=UPI00235192D7|nr:HIT domain-containing protein [Pseudomonas syringae]MCF8984602.1 HIT domain-containing protein [Pseudomonas syringae]MCF9004956.1 HIT domain-containing protein [Pseudomonas syringae]
MDLHGNYNPTNPFSSIIQGEVSSYTVFEDDDVMAFLDIFPQSLGHVLVIPKCSNARNILDVAPDTLAQMIKVVQKVCIAVVDELSPDGVQVIQCNGTAAGQTIYHIHFHIIPRWTGKPPSPRGLEISDPVYLQSIHRHLKVRIAGTAEI